MNIKVKDLMAKSVITTMPHKTVGHAQSIMKKNKIKSIPVIDAEMNIKRYYHIIRHVTRLFGNYTLKSCYDY